MVTFKLLWIKNSILWNVGHFVQCLHYMIKFNFISGLKAILASSTSKVLIHSITDPKSFVELVHKMQVVFNLCLNKNE